MCGGKKEIPKGATQVGVMCGGKKEIPKGATQVGVLWWLMPVPIFWYIRSLVLKK